jgi:hypothetical protein
MIRVKFALNLLRYYFYGMLTQMEEDFIKYWEANRSKQKKNSKQFIIGLTAGLAASFSIFIFIFSGWYERATMQANSRLSPTLFAIIILIISVFMAYLYRSYKWEQSEQQYLELLAKKKKGSPLRS